MISRDFCKRSVVERRVARLTPLDSLCPILDNPSSCSGFFEGFRQMSHAELAKTELAKTSGDPCEPRDGISPAPKGPVRAAVEAALDLLDRGEARVAERGANGNWSVNQWLKKAVLLSFRLNDMSAIGNGPGNAVW